MTELKQAALHWRKRGFSPIAVGGNKKPIGKWKVFADRQPTKDEIEEMFTSDVYGIGIVSGVGGFLCLDVDVKSDNEATVLERMSLAKNIEKLFDGKTLMAKSQSGGLHVYLKSAESNDFRVLPFGEFRSAGTGGAARMTVIPPSQMPGQKRYKFINQEPILEVDDAWAIVQTTLNTIGIELEDTAPKAVLDAESGKVTVGNRHDFLVKRARHLRGIGLSPSQIDSTFKGWRVDGVFENPESIGDSEIENAANWTKDIPTDEQIEKHESKGLLPKKGRTYSSNDNSANSATPNGGKSPEKWFLPIEFDNYNLDPFPLDALPKSLATWAKELAVETQTPVDMAAMTALAVVSTAVQRKFVVRVKRNWTETLSVWVAVAMPSGDRKSAVHDPATKPIRDYQAAQAIDMADEITESQARYEVLKDEKDSIIKSKKIKDREEKITKLAGVKKLLAEHKIIKAPRYICGDVTSEKLTVLMSQHNESMGIFDDEGTAFSIICGRYSKEVNAELFLKSYTGSTVDVDRQNKGPIHMNRPAIAMALACQPSVLRDLGKVGQLKDRGFFGRFWFVVPKSFIGRRDTDAPAMSSQVSAEYEKIITNLLKIRPQTDEWGNISSYILKLSPDAYAVVQKFAARIEPELSQYGRLSDNAEFAKKLVGGVVRIAGLMHLINNQDQPWSVDVSEDTMLYAVVLGDYLTSHALAAMDIMGADKNVDDARYLLHRITHSSKVQEQKSLSKRDTFELTKKRFKRVEAMEDAIQLLIDHDYIRDRGSQRTHEKGRNPSPLYEVNPHVLGSLKSHI